MFVVKISKLESTGMEDKKLVMNAKPKDTWIKLNNHEMPKM